MNSDRIIRIGTRGSQLAMIQTDMVIAKLRNAYPEYQFVKVEITTRGDADRTNPIYEFGGKAVFVEDIERAITNGTIDMAVHSAKDMPNPCGAGLAIAAALRRANPRDVLIYRRANPIDRASDIRLGTSSLRREYQIKKIFPRASCVNIRGNIGTRLSKLRKGEYDAIILAAAGIERQGLDREADLFYMELDIEAMLPAAGQGIIAVETLDKGYAYDMAATISDRSAEFILKAEREVLNRLGASCHEPIGVYADMSEEAMCIRLMRLVDGEIVRKSVNGRKEELKALIDELCR